MKNQSLIESVVSAGLSLYNSSKIKNPETKKILEVIQATNLHNAKGEYPIFQKCEPTPNGGLYTFRLQPGITQHDFLERKCELETWTGCKIDIYPTDNPFLQMQLIKANFPGIIPYSTLLQPEDMLAPLPIGVLPSGEIYWIDLLTLPNILVGGLPGYGKTSWLIGATLALKTKGVEVFAIDRKRIDFPPLKTFLNVAQSEEEALSLVKMLLAENIRRQTIIQSTPGVRKIQDNTSLFPPIVLIVDECALIETKETYRGIITLCTTGRASGISVLLATQKPSAGLWEKEFGIARDMCAGRVCFYVADYMTSQLILGKGNTNGARLPAIKGRASCSIGEREFTVQTMYLEPTECEQKLSELDSKPYFSSIEPAMAEKKKRGRPRKNKEG